MPHPNRLAAVTFAFWSRRKEFTPCLPLCQHFAAGVSIFVRSFCQHFAVDVKRSHIGSVSIWFSIVHKNVYGARSQHSQRKGPGTTVVSRSVSCSSSNTLICGIVVHFFALQATSVDASMEIYWMCARSSQSTGCCNLLHFLFITTKIDYESITSTRSHLEK